MHLQPLITPWQQPDLDLLLPLLWLDPPKYHMPGPARYGDVSPAAASCSSHLLGLKLAEHTGLAAAGGCYFGSLPTNLYFESHFRGSPLQPSNDNLSQPSRGAGSTLGSNTLACTQLIPCQPWPCPAL